MRTWIAAAVPLLLLCHDVRADEIVNLRCFVHLEWSAAATGPSRNRSDGTLNVTVRRFTAPEGTGLSIHAEGLQNAGLDMEKPAGDNTVVRTQPPPLGPTTFIDSSTTAAWSLEIIDQAQQLRQTILINRTSGTLSYREEPLKPRPQAVTRLIGGSCGKKRP